MRTFTTIGIYNDFTSGKSGITMWPTNHEFTGWVDMVFDFVVKQFGVFLIFRFYARYQDGDNIFFDFCQHFGL